MKFSPMSFPWYLQIDPHDITHHKEWSLVATDSHHQNDSKKIEK